jgi:hypothetical protein
MVKNIQQAQVELPSLNPAQADVVTAPVDNKPKINLAYARDKDRQMVKGIFRFHEVPGGELSFSILLHRGDQLKNYTVRDGEVSTIPLGVAKHLNKNCAYPVHGYGTDENGKPLMKVTQMVRRCSFQSLEFMEVEDLTPVGSPA